VPVQEEEDLLKELEELEKNDFLKLFEGEPAKQVTNLQG